MAGLLLGQSCGLDSVFATLNEFKAKERLSIDLLSDFKREVSRKYGTLIEEKFFSNRAYFLIDKQGIVRHIFSSQLDSDRHVREALATLSTLNASHEPEV